MQSSGKLYYDQNAIFCLKKSITGTKVEKVYNFDILEHEILVWSTKLYLYDDCILDKSFEMC